MQPQDASLDEFCRAHCDRVSDSIYSCSLCPKFFKSELFVHRHMRRSHLLDTVEPIPSRRPPEPAGVEEPPPGSVAALEGEVSTAAVDAMNPYRPTAQNAH